MPYKDPEQRKKYQRRRYENHQEWKKEYAKQYYWENKEKIRAYRNDWYKKNRHTMVIKGMKMNEYHRVTGAKHRARIKREVFEHYGNRCVCCRESRFEFLGIDHIAGGGNKHRADMKMTAGHGTYMWLRKNKFPEGFRLLCHNCNQSLGFYGHCPHENEKHIGVPTLSDFDLATVVGL